jgi:hypothetical protein
MMKVYCAHRWSTQSETWIDKEPKSIKLCARCPAVWVKDQPEPKELIAYVERE